MFDNREFYFRIGPWRSRLQSRPAGVGGGGGDGVCEATAGDRVSGSRDRDVPGRGVQGGRSLHHDQQNCQQVRLNVEELLHRL